MYEIFYSTYFAHFGTRIILLPALWIILSHSFRVLESLHCNFHNVENSNCTYHIVENIKRCFPHCGHYQRFPQNYLIFLQWQYALLIIWNIHSIFLKFSLQICWYFHKSFRNLPNFFREHARGARAKFHLWFGVDLTSESRGTRPQTFLWSDGRPASS